MASNLTALHGRRVVLGVSGGIAAYKAIEVCRQLVDAGAHVMPVLTEDSLRFVGALTFSALASEPARTSLFDAPEPIPHTRLGQIGRPDRRRAGHREAARQVHRRDLRRPAHRDAARHPCAGARRPAMHTEMWEHPAVQDNIATLRRRGVHVVGPDERAARRRRRR